MTKGSYKKTKEHCEKIGKTLSEKYKRGELAIPTKGRHRTEEEKRKISLGNKGKTMSIESRKKMSLAKVGYVTWMEGKKHKKESIEKMRISSTGKKHTQETRDKLSIIHKGKILSKETKQKISKANKGLKRSEEHKLKYRGKNKHSWKGGRIIDKSGYILVQKPEHPFSNKSGYVREHRLVIEKHLGRYLEPGEVVHHLDGNESNNNLSNLHFFSNPSEHTKYHRLLRNCVLECLKERIVQLKV